MTMDKGNLYTVADIGLADEGALRVDWARSRMPVLAALKEQAEKEKPLAGMRVAGCLHVTKETAVLIETIRAAGAEISWSGCNPLSTQDDVAAWLAKRDTQCMLGMANPEKISIGVSTKPWNLSQHLPWMMVQI